MDSSLSSRERIEKRLGKELALKYRDLEPLLALLEYRYQEETESGGDCTYGLTRIFFFDTLHGKKIITRIFGTVIAPVLWAVTRIKYLFRDKAKTRIVFSNTFLFSRRYPMVREQVDEKYGCTAILSFYDTIKRSTPNAKEMLRDTLLLHSGNVRPVYIPRYSVVGANLQKNVTKYYQLIHRLSSEKNTVSRDKLETTLIRVQSAYNKRIAYLKKRLEKEKIKLYITINQYNLRDLLLIHAFKDLCVSTMQQEHHAMQYSRLPFDPDNPKPRLSFVHNYGYWDSSERLFHQMVFLYENVLYSSKKNRYIVSGNTEMSYEQVIAYQKKYPAVRKLTFMSAAPDFASEEEQHNYERWRWSVFAALRELSEKQKIQICVRYTPFFEKYFREKEIPVLKEWGFQISESVPENLMEDMCSCTAIMSSTSSVLATARLMGKIVYRVEDPDIRYIHVDDRIHEVKVSEIPNIVIPENKDGFPGQVDPEGFFEIDRVLHAVLE